MKRLNHYKLTHLHFFLLLGAGLLLRVIFAVSNIGFGNDTACFAAWADRMFTVGPAGFYTEDFFTDYPPGFLYVLSIIGALRSFFQIPKYCGLHLLLLKLPAIICDILCCCVLYRESCTKLSRKASLGLSAAYLLNPAVLLNSSIWGQVDSVFTLMIVCMCVALTKKKLLPAYLFFGMGVLLKPQTLVFTPVLLAGILDYVFLHDFQCKKMLRNVMQGLYVIAGMLFLCLPFGLENVLAQYADTLASYPYVSVNAYNFWGLLGLNWSSQNNTFFFLSYKQWGLVVILLIVIFTFVISLRRRDDSTKYPLLAAFIILSMFLFSVRMHERYLYPGLLLLLLCCLYYPSKQMYLCYGGFSLLHFCNTAHVLFFYHPENYNAKAPVILLISAGMVLCIGYFYYILRKLMMNKHTMNQKQSQKQPPLLRGLPPLPSDKPVAFTRWDLLWLFAIMILYSCFALYDLGDSTAPVTAYEMNQKESIVLDFGEGQKPATLSYYIAPWHDRNFTLEVKEFSEDS